MSAPTLIINFKNYGEVLGEKSLELAKYAEKVARSTGVEVIVSPPHPMLHSVAKAVRIGVFSQKLDEGEEGKSTGSLIPESVSRAGCTGSILNHSESRIGLATIGRLLPRMRSLSLVSCVCAETLDEVSRIAELSPDFLAIEPPELIGTGISVSKARPEIITESVRRARKKDYAGRMLCGAGIVTADDAIAARKLGVQGLLVASSIVKSPSWEEKIGELSKALLP